MPAPSIRHEKTTLLRMKTFTETTVTALIVFTCALATFSLLATTDLAFSTSASVSLIITCLLALAGMFLSQRNLSSSRYLSTASQTASIPLSAHESAIIIDSAPTAIAILQLAGDQLFHHYQNSFASRLFSTSLEVQSVPGSCLPAPVDINTLLLEQCRESKVRAAPVKFEFQTNRVGQHRWFSATVYAVPASEAGSDRFVCFIENTTQIKENESALLGARERLAAALEAGALATWDWDIQRDVVYGDQVLVNLYGAPREYIHGAPVNKFLEHIYHEDRERIRKQIHSAVESGSVYSEQYRVINSDGVLRWVSATGRVLDDASGKPARFPGVTVDITPLKEAEAALLQATTTSQNQLRELESIYTYAPVGLAVIGSDYRWIRANKVMADYFAKKPEDFVGKLLHEVAPTLVDGLERHLQLAIDTKKSVLHVEVSGECPITPGSIRTWSTNFYPLISSQDTIFGINVVTEDITEDKRAIEEHRAHREILNMVALNKPLEEMLNTLTRAIEAIFPGATSYILHNHHEIALIAPLTNPERATIDSLFNPPLSAEELLSVTDVITKQEELLISDLKQSRDTGYLARARRAGFRSCWIKPIVLTDGHPWGVCVIHHATIQQNPTHQEREHLDVLLKLATTVIERRAFFEQLTSTTERLQHAEQVGHIGVFDWDPQTGIVVWTPQLEAAFGLEPGMFEGTFEAWKKQVHPDDVEGVVDYLTRLRANKQAAFKQEYRIICPSGDERWIAAQGEFSYNDAGQATRMVGVATDITARKRIEDQSRRDQERLKLALEAGNLGFWDWHIPSGAVQFGGNWASMLGYSHEQIEPHIRSWERLIHPNDKPEVERALALHLAGKTAVYEVEHRLRTKSGEWLWVLDRGQVVERNPRGEPIRALGIHADIHEQRMIREQLNSEAKRKDEFIATLAHELRNPLAPIRTGLEIIRRDPSGAAASTARDMMSRQLAHMVRLIEDLLDISRISLGRLELRMERVALREVVDSALESSRPAIDAAQHQLSVTLPERQVFLKGDSARLSQVLSNLLINAAKYTPLGGRILLEALVQDAQVTIRVTDNGIGIPQSKLSEIFEMFSQVQSPLDRSQGGLGIGLALVRRLVQMHHGVVFAESPGPGLGSSFTVRLPEG